MACRQCFERAALPLGEGVRVTQPDVAGAAPPVLLLLFGAAHLIDGVVDDDASSPFGMGSHGYALLGEPWLPASSCFLVRLKAAVSSSRPDTPKAARAAAVKDGRPATARLRGAQRS